MNTFPGFSQLKYVTAEDKIKYPHSYPDGFDRYVFNPKSTFGLLYRSQFENGDRETFFYDGIEVEFEDFWPTDIDGKQVNLIRAFYSKTDGGGEWETISLWIPITKIDLESLKKLELWTILPEDLKTSLETKHVFQVQEDVDAVKNRMTAARLSRKRDPAHENFPRELICCVKYCNYKLPYISPKMLIEKAKEKGCTVEEFTSNWKCRSCEPRHRGRQVSAKWAGLPKELICACGNTLKQHPGVTEKQAEAAGIVFSEYVKSWQCKSCRKSDPTTTRTTTTRGRKEKTGTPWFGKAKELTCACGKIQKQHGSITMSQAEKVGKTYEEYVASWQCIDCRPQGMKRVRAGNTQILSDNGNLPVNPPVPKETACVVCKNKVKLVPKNIIEKAKILGITIEELVNNYHCRSCGGRLPKGSKRLLEVK